MLTINNLSYHIGSRTLFDEVTLQITERDKIGLIGPNGAGKSTLLRLIAGEYTPDGGEVTKSNDCSIGYLNQDMLSFESELPITQVAMEAFEKENLLQEKIDATLREMEENYRDELVDKLSKLQHEFEMLGGYTIQARSEAILEGLGFSTEDLQKPLKVFSGGWRMRVILAKLLLAKPAVLLLDEPTNHLDLPSIQWLETYLSNYEGSVVIVSHDREFLDNSINKIVEVSSASLNVYPGNYSFYLEEKELREEIQKNAFQNQQQKIKQTEKFIERFKAKATKAKQVQSRVKMLEKMDKVQNVQDDNPIVNFSFNFDVQPGKVLYELDHISKSYKDITVFDDTHALLNRGDKIALIGANGKGKSTLLRIIAGTESHKGERKEGYNVIPSFYGQHQLESLNIEHTILEELQSCGSHKSETELRSVLGCFLFTEDDVFKKIKVLSGGERSRVALAKVLISESNFLLLDEPTNHLDIQSVNVLTQALQQYKGTYLVVSHDRHFINNIANKIWYIEDRKLKEYPGSYHEFEWWFKQKAQENKKQENKKQEKKNSSTGKQEKKPQKPADQKELEKYHKQLEKTESTMEELEKKIVLLEEEMAKPSVYGNPDVLAEKNEAYLKLKKEHELLQEKWDSLATEIDRLD